MNFDQFAATFQNPEVRTPTTEPVSTKESGAVVLAGTIMAATKDSFSIEINGAVYEGAASDVIDVETISSKPPETSAEKTGAKDAAEKGAAKRPAEKVKTENTTETRGPRLAFVRLKGNAILVQRIPAPAALLAACGTWVQVVAEPAKAA